MTISLLLYNLEIMKGKVIQNSPPLLLNTYFLSGCAASSAEGVPIRLIVAII
jgi:hypothetical protein